MESSDKKGRLETRAGNTSSATSDSSSQKRGCKRPHRDATKDPWFRASIVTSKFLAGGLPSYESNRDVARLLGLNTVLVGSALDAAWKAGEFTVQVHLPQEIADISRLEKAVEKEFNLRRVMLVPGLPGIGKDLDRQQLKSLHNSVILSMTERAAMYLDAVMSHEAGRQAAVQASGQEVKPFVLGVAWGRTMHMLAERLHSRPRDIACPGLRVVPIVGITSAWSQEPIEANVVAMNIAGAYGGVFAHLQCPAFVPSFEESLATQFQQVKETLDTIRQCKAVVTSMGPIPKSADGASEIRLSGDARMNRELFASARARGAIGDMSGWFFDRQGKEVRTDYRTIGLGFAGLRRIAADENRQVILIAGGDRRRFEPLKGALRARLASVLVSDTVTARYLLGELKKAGGDAA